MGSYNYYKMFGCFNRKFKISEAEPPPDVRDAFSRYAENGPHMNAEQLARFLVEYQGEQGCTVDDAAGIIQQIHKRRQHLSKHTHRFLDLDGFFEYLFQDDLNGPLNTQVSHDMTAPLQHYFIYTGHNSYLTGNQLSSKCSEIPIIRALERGVRGIELDLWPNSAKDNIHVLHGRTLTTPVTLFKCLKSIKKHAFVKSPYPVIITLEDHLTPELQAKAAEMLTEVFGEMLYCPESHCLEELPSPKELKHRIVLSTKAPKEYLESRQSNDKETASPAGKDSKDSSEDESSMKETAENEAEGSNSDPDGECSEASTSQHGGTENKCVDAEKISTEKQDADRNDEGGDASTRRTPEYKCLDAEKTNAEQQDADKRKNDLVDEISDASTQRTPEYKCLNAEKTNGEQQDANKSKNDLDDEGGDASTRRTPENKCLNAEKTNIEQQDANKSKNDLDDEGGDASTQKTPESKGLDAEKTNAEQQDADMIKNDLDDEGDASNRRAPEYKRLIAIRAGKAKQGLKHALTTVQEKVKRISVNEGDLEKAAGSYGTDVVRFTQKSILRVYPKGTRVTSSNFKPMLGWMHGAQMVAFNMQGYGKSLWLMHGMFRANGGCGYVKKPQFLLERGPNDEVFDPKVTLQVKFTLKVSVYLGDGWRLDFSHTHFDAYSPPDFYTKLYIIGAPADGAKKKTRIIEDDWGPHWGEEFEFPLTVPELALLRIEVREYDMSEKDDFGGQTCLPVSELRPGVRAVPLHDKKGQKLKSVRLLMRFQFL